MIALIVSVSVMLISVPLFYTGMYLRFAAKRRRACDGQRLCSSEKLVKITNMAAAVLYCIDIAVGVSLLCARMNAAAVIVPTAIFFAMSATGAYDALRVKFNCVLMDDDGITLVRINRKDKHIEYSQIAYYVASDVMRQRNRLNCSDIVYECYDRADNKRFTVSAGFESISAFTDKMTELGIPLSDYPQKFVQDQKRVCSWAACACLAFCAAVFFGIFGLMFALSETERFQNYAVRGAVQSCAVDGVRYERLIVKLKNDEGKYVVPNSYLRLVDKSVTEAATDGTQITLLIAYKDDGEYIISQIEIDGKIYLSADKAQAAVSSEDRTSRMISFIFLAIGIGTLAIAVFVGAKAIKHNKKRAE